MGKDTESLIRTLSQDRFETYRREAGHNNQERAFKLYLWNIRIGEAFFLPLHVVEIGLRNAINRALVDRYSVNWWDDDIFKKFIDDPRKSDLKLLHQRLQNKKIEMVNGQVVAGLSFGFWVGMLEKRYHPELWSRYLKTVFPHLPDGYALKAMRKKSQDALRLRNRISHHEPLIKWDISKYYAELMTLVYWLEPAMHDWILPHCRVPALMREKP